MNTWAIAFLALVGVILSAPLQSWLTRTPEKAKKLEVCGRYFLRLAPTV